MASANIDGRMSHTNQLYVELYATVLSIPHISTAARTIFSFFAFWPQHTNGRWFRCSVRRFGGNFWASCGVTCASPLCGCCGRAGSALCTAVVPDGLVELLLRRAALVAWRERLYELVLCFWYDPCSSHFLLKFDCSLTAEFSARTIVQQDLTRLLEQNSRLIR